MNTKTLRARIRQSLADETLQTALDGNAQRRTVGRLNAFASVPDYQERRARAHAIKADVIAHLEEYLSQFLARVTENGIQVHRAADAQEAMQIFLSLAKKHNAHLVAKGKSMVSEEIHFNHALEAAGIQVVETDLGEYIVQLRGERPSHILTPAVHLTRGQVGQLFHEKLGCPYTEDIPEMVATARRVLRQVFLTADIGVSGVNFGVVETGTLCLVTNEGNGRMVTSLPPVHVALMGIERLVPTLDDLGLFLSLLPRSGTGQKLSVYTSLIHSPKRVGDVDGPRERHLILVDNGRSGLRASPLAESLYCIRCGACLNACPVFREIGGHAYIGQDGSIAPYPGPIGAVISPGLSGCENFGQLAQASSLCGACQEACPVDINLPELLLRVRAGEMEEKTKNNNQKEGVGVPGSVKAGLVAFRLAASRPMLFSISQRLGGLFSRAYSPRNPYMRIPAWTGWGYSKDFPRLEPSPFRARWKKIKQENHPREGTIRQPGQARVPGAPEVPALADQFIEELAVIGVTTYRLPEKEVRSRLAEFLQVRGVKRVHVDDAAETYAAGIPFIREPDPSVRVGITGALLGIAESGSLVLVGGEGHPLTASLLPDIHIVVLRESDLVRSLPEALCRPEIRNSSAAVILTGPSRTGDIEMTLSIGVHGPKEVHVFLIEDSN
ncbi:MAG: LutB/LldF family L-lactate oxidation iron-sulfur protein [Anaerolineales bacterium]